LKHLNTFVISLLVVILTTLAASCGGSNIGIVQPENNDLITQENNSTEDLQEFEGLPNIAQLEEQFAKDAGQDDKGASWLSHPNHLAPIASFNGGIDPGDPSCYLLKGFKGAVVGGPNGPQIAYAIYQIPLGALETDLLEMKVAAQISSATESYFAAIANFTGMTWDFAGPFTASSWQTDMTALGYDFTGAGGNMYIALIAMPDTALHITDITLNFKDREKPNDKEPTWWNVYGQAYDDYLTNTPHANYQVTFEDIHTGVTYTTMTSSAGRWGMNLPTGEYQFSIDSNEMLLDVSGATAMIDYIYQVDGIGIRLDLDNTGQIVYQDVNYAAYTGSVVPMPLITSNNF
jgi:hypothetical protein